MDEAFAVFTAFLLAAGPLAVGVEKIVAGIKKLVDAGGKAPGVVWIILAFVVGVGMCLMFQWNVVAPLADLIPALKGSSRLDGVAGQILTGIAVGAMAGLWHDKIVEYRAAGARNPE